MICKDLGRCDWVISETGEDCSLCGDWLGGREIFTLGGPVVAG